MTSKDAFYLPSIFRSFQGFRTVDIKEWRKESLIQIILEKEVDKIHYCGRCGEELGAMHDRYLLKVKHLKMMGWNVELCFWREKRKCYGC